MKKRKMTNDELVNEINWFCKDVEPQSEDNLMYMEFEYRRMFQEYCNTSPNFTIDQKGQITIQGRVQKK